MSNESTVKLYAAAFLARREIDGQPILRVQSGVVLAYSEAEAQVNGMEGARQLFPETENWGDHGVIIAEIPRSLDLGYHHITWDATRRDP